MADTASFPTTLGNVHHNNGPTYTFTAGADILKGQVVAYAATGVSMTVQPGVSGTTGPSIGVAIIPASSGDPVTVALIGSIVTVSEGAGGAIDAGDDVSLDDNANAKGSVVKTVTTAADSDIIGRALNDIAANGTGKILITGPGINTTAAAG